MSRDLEELLGAFRKSTEQMKAENAELKNQASQIPALNVKISELEKRLDLARKSKSTLQTIEDQESKITRLEAKLLHFDKVKSHNSRLEAVSKDAAKDKSVLRSIIETHEQTITELSNEVGFLKARHDQNTENAGVAQMYVDRLTYIATKLRVKPGHRTAKELLSAIEDAVRKLM